MTTFYRINPTADLIGNPSLDFEEIYCLPNMNSDDAIALIDAHLKAIKADALLIKLSESEVLIKLS